MAAKKIVDKALYKVKLKHAVRYDHWLFRPQDNHRMQGYIVRAIKEHVEHFERA